MQRITKAGIALVASLLIAAPTAAFATTQQTEGDEPEICWEEGTETHVTYDLQRSDWVAGTPEIPAVPDSAAPLYDYSETRATGHFEPAADGLHIWTEGATSTDKVALYRSVSIPLASVTAASVNYTATTGITPGSQLVVDIDGDAVGDGILVGEPVYGDAHWLSNSASAAFKALAPHVGGGYGSENYGTLTEWATAAPGATIVAVGFSLGSGVLGDGVVHGVWVGATLYSFTQTIPGTPGVPAVPDSYTDWYVVSSGQGTALPDGRGDGEQFQTDGLYRYVITGEIEVPTQVEVECPVTEPEPEPTTEPTPEPTVEPAPTATPAPAVAKPAASEGDLAETGGDNGVVALLVGGSLLVAGIGLTVVLGLRRRTRQQ